PFWPCRGGRFFLKIPFFGRARVFGGARLSFSVPLATNLRLAGCVARTPSTILKKAAASGGAHPTFPERRSIDNAA
ncbi:hypothetical protein NKJ31_20415, partial [Mesorhizobium sp. M0133]|uniref:hypothetical protein n=1 Tax=Mesorhizobium sp. M0133 TaxID=2956888 RepID=UPI0033375E06